MSDISGAFDTYLVLDPNLSESELEQEIAFLIRRQEAIYGLLDGTRHLDEVEAMLAEDGLDPYEWAEIGEQNLIWMLGDD